MHDPQLTHHIQLEILKTMVTKPELRYSELKPPQLEANLFMYHLNQLIKVGLIEKHDRTYALTRNGKRFADRATLASMKIKVQPKCVTVLAIRRADKQLLILERLHQPFIGYKGFPSGKMEFGETLLQAAERELFDKSGLQHVPLELKGNIVMRFTDAGETINHIIGYVFYGEVPADTTVDHRQQHFHSYFAPESELFAPPCFKGHQEILNLLRNERSPFLWEGEFQSDF